MTCHLPGGEPEDALNDQFVHDRKEKRRVIWFLRCFRAGSAGASGT